MNLLAHAALSGDDDGRIVGGIVADLVKGPVPDDLPAGIGAGIRLHRGIDVFTDAHPLTARSRDRLRARWGRYSGILVDFAYDFCLVRCWDRFGTGRLPDFVGRVYRALEASAPLLPGRIGGYARVMIREDWLTSYGTWEGMRTALRRISGRLKRPVDLSGGADDVRREEEGLTADFREFFPELARHAGLLY